MPDAIVPSIGAAPPPPPPVNLPRLGTCSNWITATDVEGFTSCTDVAEDSPMLQIASDVLFKLSGGKYAGSCSDTVRPGIYCSCADGYQGRCCGGKRWLTFGSYPVTEITQVRMDGKVVDPSTYRLHDHSRLYRVYPEVWPCCFRVDAPDEDSLIVDLTYGTPPPEEGKLAAAKLACELLKGASGDSACELPERVQTLTRDGVTMAMLDPMAFLENGRTGLYVVDLFLASEGSGGSQSAGVASPDTPRASRVTQ